MQIWDMYTLLSPLFPQPTPHQHAALYAHVFSVHHVFLLCMMSGVYHNTKGGECVYFLMDPPALERCLIRAITVILQHISLYIARSISSVIHYPPLTNVKLNRESRQICFVFCEKSKPNERLRRMTVTFGIHQGLDRGEQDMYQRMESNEGVAFWQEGRLDSPTRTEAVIPTMCSAIPWILPGSKIFGIKPIPSGPRTFCLG